MMTGALMFLANAAPRTPFESGPNILAVAGALFVWNVLACVHWHRVSLRPGQAQPQALGLLAFSVLGAIGLETIVVFGGFQFALLLGPLLLGVSAAWASVRGLHARMRVWNQRGGE